MRAGPVRSLPRNRGGKRRRPREVEGPERVVSPEVEVAEEGYGQCRERSSRLYRGGGCESRELDRQLVHDPDRLLFQGFRFPVRGHPFARTRRFSPYPAVSDPSLHLTFTSLIFRRPFFTVPPLFLLDFRSYPFANRCLSLTRVATFGRTCVAYTLCVRPVRVATRLRVFVVVLAGIHRISRITRVRIPPGAHDAR